MNYNWNAEEYFKSSSQQLKWGNELLAKLNLNGNEKILDIGCGDGKITAEISKMVKNGFVLGIDNSKEMIEFAQKHFPQSTFHNLKFILMDAKDINFENEFDIIFSNATLHWIINHSLLLKKISKALKNKGKILFQMGGKGNAEDLILVFEDIMQKQNWKLYFEDFSFPYGFYDTETYKHWLKEANLTCKRVELIPKDMIHDNKEKFTGWIKTTWMPYTHRVPESMRDYFIDEVVNEYLKKFPPDENGSVHIKMIRLEVEAEKFFS